jgi:hypothetical protein
MIIGGGAWEHARNLRELTDDELLVVAKLLTERATPEPVWDAIQLELARRVALQGIDLATRRQPRLVLQP